MPKVSDLPTSSPATVTALGTVLAGTFAPIVDRLAIRAQQMNDPSSGAANVAVGTTVAVALRDAVSDRLTAIIDLPSHWTAINVNVEWTLAASASGDAALRFDYYAVVDGTNLNTATITNGPLTPCTAPAQYVVKTSPIASGLAVDATKRLFVRLIRVGADASDTLTASAAILRLVITNANA